MSITPVTFFLLAYFFYLLFKQKRISDLVESFVYLNVSLTLFLQSGYAISYGSYSVTAGILFSTLSAVICLLLLASQKIVKKHRLALCSLLLILVCVISLVRLSIFKYEVVRAGGPLMPWDTYKLYTSSIISMGLTSTNYLTFFKTASYCILAGAAHIYLNAENWKKIIKKCYRIGKAVVIYGIIELIFAYILRKNLYSTVTSLFIGRSSFTYTTLGESRGVNVMLQGITREPSFYAVQMFFILILFTAEGVLFKDKYAKYWNLIVIALMLLSMSFTSLLMIALYAYIMYLRMNTGKRTVIATVLFLFFPLLIVAGVILIRSGSSSFYVKRIIITVDVLRRLAAGETASPDIFRTSPGCRLASSVGTMVYFFKYFFFGLGPGTTISHTLTSYTLANYGILGSSLWYRITFTGGLSASYEIKKEYKMAVICFILSFLLASGIEINSLCYLLLSNCLMVIFLKQHSLFYLDRITAKIAKEDL